MELNYKPWYSQRRTKYSYGIKVLLLQGQAYKNGELLGLTFGQKSITGSGGYTPQDVKDVMEIMKSKKWEIEKMITHEYHLEELSRAIEKASNVDDALNVIIKHVDYVPD